MLTWVSITGDTEVCASSHVSWVKGTCSLHLLSPVMCCAKCSPILRTLSLALTRRVLIELIVRPLLLLLLCFAFASCAFCVYASLPSAGEIKFIIIQQRIEYKVCVLVYNIPRWTVLTGVSICQSWSLPFSCSGWPCSSTLHNNEILA